MENKKVMVTSNAVGRVIINVPSMHFRREWERKGAKKPIEMEILREIFYDPGIEKMFRMGILYIEDMSVKIELDLEEEGTEEPTNIVVLSDKQRAELLGDTTDFENFRETCNNLSQQELANLVDYAIEKQLINMDKCRYLKIKTGKDIIRTIENNREE